MAETNSSAIGESLNGKFGGVGENGSSMRNVTGYEQVFAAQAKAKTGALEIDTSEASAKYGIPVDTENKAKIVRYWSVAMPHMRAFHLSWFSFMTSFVSTFAPAALITIIRDDLNMDSVMISNSNIAAVLGAIASRVVMGTFCDMYGPRYGHAFLMMFCATPVYCMVIAPDFSSYVALRFFIGFSLATFVATQFWSSVMFNSQIVGHANATTAGWGNMGGGITHALMPGVYTGLLNQYGLPMFRAWRCTFFVPGCMHILVGVLVLFFSQDLPDGNYYLLKKSGNLKAVKTWPSLRAALYNYRVWVITITYGYCFGVELTMDNIITQYFQDFFGFGVDIAGTLGSIFGLLNIFARTSGGLLSDLCAVYFGMRGRLWCLYFLQTIGGMWCICMGWASFSFSTTIVFMVLFSIFIQSSCGASFGIVPFLTKRGLGVASGMIGAGGNAGSAITQAIFFGGAYGTDQGIQYMGVMVMCMTLLVALVHFPMWGSMFLPPTTQHLGGEDTYYTSDYSQQEVANGDTTIISKFAAETHCERGPLVEKLLSESMRGANEAAAVLGLAPMAAGVPADIGSSSNKVLPAAVAV